MGSKLIYKAGYYMALLLLGLQTAVIVADFVMNTWIFDETLSWMINAAMVWIVKKQHDQYIALSNLRDIENGNR